MTTPKNKKIRPFWKGPSVQNSWGNWVAGMGGSSSFPSASGMIIGGSSLSLRGQPDKFGDKYDIRQSSKPCYNEECTIKEHKIVCDFCKHNKMRETGITRTYRMKGTDSRHGGVSG